MLVAQLTDIHASPASDNIARFEAALVWLKSLRPDILVVTGDLVDDGWAEGYRTVKDLLDALDHPVFVLPGNADDKGLLQTMMPERIKTRPDGAMHFVHRCETVQIIGVDVCVEGQAYGDITPHLPWLEATLNGLCGDSALIFMHHPVFASGIDVLDEAMCRGVDGLRAILSSASVPPLAICSGHVHRPMASAFAGIPAFICGSICPANPLWLHSSVVPSAPDPAALMIHDICNGRLVSSHVSLPS
ncbi:metallophosphoesterase [Allorhizobium sp. BGMRC 0089]|uniref:metallophosphoesterase n=1 Tax=Allorhizobium sonneratiae TaxID=2934936 RepID=UPI002033A45E|nr:metallophosphoesterase [Allorhizobium sonneratiae]MCM2294183.1 metallophosphoesterase [Allorhizobium sonneratiae]